MIRVFSLGPTMRVLIPLSFLFMMIVLSITTIIPIFIVHSNFSRITILSTLILSLVCAQFTRRALSFLLLCLLFFANFLRRMLPFCLSVHLP